MTTESGAPVSLAEVRDLLLQTAQVFERTTAQKQELVLGGGSENIAPNIGSPHLGSNAKQRTPLKSRKNRCRARNAVGQHCVTWHCSARDKPSFAEATVADVYCRDGNEVAVLDSGVEMTVQALSTSVTRASKALAVEKQWLKLLQDAGLSAGASIAMWVPDEAQEISSTAEDAQMSTPGPQDKQQDAWDASSASPTPIGSPGRRRCRSRTDSNPYANVTGLRKDSRHPGNLHTFIVRSVEILWHFQSAEVKMTAAKMTVDGRCSADEVFSGEQIFTMLKHGRLAQEVLNRHLRWVKHHDGVCVGAHLDVWLEDQHVTARGTVVAVGQTFTGLETVELHPYVKYVLEGQEHFLYFDEYAEFITCWRQARYVKEQEEMLDGDARSHGVAAGRSICVHQPPNSARWPFKHGGALDAEVAQTAFLFDPTRNEVSLHVQTRYNSQGLSGAKRLSQSQRRISLDDDSELALEWLPFEQLQPRLRAKLVVSDISCSDLVSEHVSPQLRARLAGARPFVKLALHNSKRKMPPALENAENPSWSGLSCVFREGEDTNRVKNHRGAHGDAEGSGGGFFDQVLQVFVFAARRGRPRMFLGYADLNLRNLLPSGEFSHTLALRPYKNKRNVSHGSVQLHLSATGPGVVAPP